MSIPELSSVVTSLERSLEATSDMAQASPCSDSDRLQEVLTPFVEQARPAMNHLRQLHLNLQKELGELLAYFGETDNTPEVLFSTILAFAHGLQKAATELTLRLKDDRRPAQIRLDGDDAVSQQAIDVMGQYLDRHEAMLSAVTIKQVPLSLNTQPSDSAIAAQGEDISQGVAGTLGYGRKRATLLRGDVDEAIRTIHGGVRRRERSTVGRGGGIKLAKMFLDGAQSGASGRGSVKVKGDMSQTR